MANYPASQPGSQRHTLSVLVENLSLIHISEPTRH